MERDIRGERKVNHPYNPYTQACFELPFSNSKSSDGWCSGSGADWNRFECFECGVDVGEKKAKPDYFKNDAHEGPAS